MLILYGPNALTLMMLLICIFQVQPKDLHNMVLNEMQWIYIINLIFCASKVALYAMYFVLLICRISCTDMVHAMHKYVLTGVNYLRVLTLNLLLLFLVNSMSWICILLIISGDVETNPGPMSSMESISDSTSFCSDSFISNLDVLHNCFSAVHLNVQSLKPKLDILETELRTFDVLAFSETWLNSSISNSDIEISGYSEPCRKDRPDGYGGVAIYIKNNIPFKPRQDLSITGLENLWVEILLPNTRILLGVLYRSPSSGSNILDLIDNNFEAAVDTGIDNIILMGDLNMDFNNSNTRKKLKQILQIYNMDQLVTEPTHFTENSSTILDLIITNNPDNVYSSGVGENILDFNIRYHCPIFGIFKFHKPDVRSFKRRVWRYNEADYDTLRNKLGEVNWENCKSTDINVYTENVIHAISANAEKVIPNKIVTVRAGEPSWISSKIKKLIRKRKRLYRKYKRNPTMDNQSKYKSLRNSIVNLIRTAKHSYYTNLSRKISDGNISGREFWKLTKLLLGNKQSTIPPICHNGQFFYDNCEKAELFNIFFQSQAYIDDSSTPVPMLDIPTTTLDRIEVNSEEVEDILKSLDTSKAVGPDGIHPRVLKESSSVLCKPLTDLFNFSLRKCIFPDSWKRANVVPIHKKSDKSLVDNYRPVSLLSIIGKVMERIIHKHVHNFFLSTNFISPFQSGFSPGDSTTNQLLFLYNSFMRAVDEGKEVRVVFCDISKAFDRVWHRGLIQKLKGAGVAGDLLEWFSNYLKDRKQRVVIAGSNSGWLDITAGVPQGSILGPLLFLVYINDITSNISSNIRLFADDTSLYLIVDLPDTAATLLNDDLSRISEWANTWLVSFNAAKTKHLLISRKRHTPVHPPLFMNNVEITSVKEHKHLGILLSNDGAWQAHIESILSKAWRRVNILRKFKFILDRKSLEKLYFSFIRPILEYSDIVWDNCSLFQSDELEKLQLEMARIVTGTTKLISIEKLYKEVGWEKLSVRRYKHKLIKFFQMYHGLAPNYLQDLVPTRINDGFNYILRNAENIPIIMCRTSTYANSFLPSVIRDWNNLPVGIRENNSLSIFKNYLNQDKSIIPKHFYVGERKSQILHARLRTGCSSLKFDLYRKNIVDSPLCTCGLIEDADHFLLRCNLYTPFRNMMLQKLQNLGEISLNLLLSGNNELSLNENNCIMKAVQEFILSTKRFG